MNQPSKTKASAFTVFNSFERNGWRIEVAVGPKEPPVHLTTVQQVHGSTILTAEAARALGAQRPEADGLILTRNQPLKPTESQMRSPVVTRKASLLLGSKSSASRRSQRSAIAVQTADCLPLVLLGDNLAVALHVSRKSIIRDLVHRAWFNIKPPQIKHVYIGPHICRNHFIFDAPDRQSIKELGLFCERYPAACDRRHPLKLSLRQAIQSHLDAWGITPDQITEDRRCTFEEENLPSYRRSRTTGEPYEKHLYTIVKPAQG